MTKVIAFAGGVGGAKLAWGLSKILPEEDFSVIVNTGDDFIHYGLNISPDLDTVMYTLAGMANQTTGWGLENETWKCLDALKKVDQNSWFALGDRDLATHLMRTSMIQDGLTLTEVTRILCEKYGVKNKIYPMCDQTVSTIVRTDEYGEISFQEYFVKYHFEPSVKDYYYQGIENAQLSDEAKKLLGNADIVIFCPSNPWLSIMPILALNGMIEIIKKKICIAVSPIVGNTAVKGPAAKMFTEMGITPSAMEVAKLYHSLIQGFVLDNQNAAEEAIIEGWGIISHVTDTIMKDENAKIRLAKEVISFASMVGQRK